MIRRDTLTLTLAALLAVVLCTDGARAGDGKYSTILGTWDFGVSMRFDATAQQIERTKTEFAKASDLIYDASDGQQEFGDVFVCNNKGAGKAAEVWILPPGTSWCSQAPGRFGVSGQHIEQCYDDMVYSNAKADGSWVVAHEWGHHAYGIKDEYSGPTAGAKECVVVPADVNARTACLIENFWNHGADGVSLTEWCVASNHDPNGDTYQESINGKSCWENLVEAYPDVTAPTDLPDAGPTTNPLPFFTWTVLEEDTRLMLVIDDSGSMGSNNKMQLAILGGKIFANLARDGHKLGVVKFNSSASTLYALTAMDAATRAAAKAAIDTLSAGGGTNIDSGLSLALSAIQGEGDRACQQAIILLSDGSQGGPVDSGLIDTLVSEGVVVHAIALGPTGVDIPTMQGVASGTGGKYFFADDGGDLPGIFAVLAAETAEGGVLNTANGTLLPGDSADVPFPVDDTTTQISFVVSWDGGDLAVGLEGPGNVSLDADTVDDDFSYSIDDTSVTMIVRGDLVAGGEWVVALSPPDDPGGLIDYDIQALSDSKELTFEAASDAQQYDWPAPMQLTATASFGAAITGIEVTGVVERPDGSTAEVILKDDGSAASGDVFPGDGVYSGRFDTWADNGEYTVEIVAVNDGGGELALIEGLIPEGETASGGEDPPDFTRNSSFSVSLEGAPFLQRFGLGVDQFKAKISTKNEAKNKLQIKSALNLAEGSVEPATDTLTIILGGLFGYDYTPDDLKQAGKKPRYVFKDKASGESGFVDLFAKGSSKGRFQFKDKGFQSSGFGGLGSLDSVDVRFLWGDMDYEATILPNANKKGTATSFKASKDTYETVEAWISSVKAKVNPKKDGADKLSLRAKLTGGFFSSFQPLFNDTVLAFGPFQVEIPSGEWKADKKGIKLSWVSQDKAIKVTYDTEREELALTAKNQSLGSLTATAQFSVDSGAYLERREIKLSVNKNGTAFSY